jgi:hypothetical protein
MSLDFLLILAALIFSIIASFGIPIRINAIGAALACYFASLLV